MKNNNYKKTTKTKQKAENKNKKQKQKGQTKTKEKYKNQKYATNKTNNKETKTSSLVLFVVSSS